MEGFRRPHNKRFNADKVVVPLATVEVARARQPWESGVRPFTVADYFALIDSGEEVSGPEITPRVRSLIGSLKGATATEEDYRRHLEEKYR